MLKLDVLRLLVDQRLSALTDEIFHRFSSMISEYEAQVHRLQQQLELQQEAPGAAPGATPGASPGAAPGATHRDPAAGVLQVVTTEEEEQPARGRSFSPSIKMEEGGASGPEGTDSVLTQSPDTDASALSNQIRSCREEAGQRPAVNKQEELMVKQEVDAAVRAEIVSEPHGVLQVYTTEEEQQVRGRSFSLHIKLEEGRASGPEETTKEGPDQLMESYEDEGSSSSNQIQSHKEEEEELSPTEHNTDSFNQSESCTDDSDDAQGEPGLQRPAACGPPADQQLLVCSSCGREFSSVRTLRKHIRRNTSQDPDHMSCSLRRQRAPFQSPAKSFMCRLCDSSFYTQGILVRHAETHCKEPENRCGACGDCLESTEVLRDHLRSHKELGSTCDFCGKKCSSIKRMEIHKRVHTGEKPYRCEFCSRDFSRKESLERHLKVHSGHRPHHCGLCSRTFTRREYLVHHLKINHMERPELPAGTEPLSVTL